MRCTRHHGPESSRSCLNAPTDCSTNVARRLGSTPNNTCNASKILETDGAGVVACGGSDYTTMAATVRKRTKKRNADKVKVDKWIQEPVQYPAISDKTTPEIEEASPREIKRRKADERYKDELLFLDSEKETVFKNKT